MGGGGGLKWTFHRGGGGGRATSPSIFCILFPNLINLGGDMVLWANIQIMVKKNLRHANVSIYFADVSKNQRKKQSFLHGGGNFQPFPSKCHHHGPNRM